MRQESSADHLGPTGPQRSSPGPYRTSLAILAEVAGPHRKTLTAEPRLFCIFIILCPGFGDGSRCEVASIPGAGSEARRLGGSGARGLGGSGARGLRGSEARGATADSAALQAPGSIRPTAPLVGFHT